MNPDSRAGVFEVVQMSERCYDAIVVGAGIAGSSAAITAARAGLDVLLLEQADTPGK